MTHLLKHAMLAALTLVSAPALAQAPGDQPPAGAQSQGEKPPPATPPEGAQPPVNVPPAGAPRAQEQLPEAPPEQILKNAPPVEKKQEGRPPEVKSAPSPLPNTLPPAKKIEPKVPNA